MTVDKQPEALRLAGELSRAWQPTAQQAAAELRRLHAANLDCMAWYEVAKSQRDELLAALQRLSFAAMSRDNTMGDPSALLAAKAELHAANQQARAAIAKATGEQK